jgi:RHH-type rel operon transcriptional repressor/antitoxin RelB
MITSIRLPEGMNKRLEALAAATNKSKSYYVKEALATYLEDLEDLAAVEAYRRNPNQKGYTTDEVLKRLGLPPIKVKRTAH